MWLSAALQADCHIICGGLFNPNLCFPLSSARAGIEQSTTCRWWDSGKPELV